MAFLPDDHDLAGAESTLRLLAMLAIGVGALALAFLVWMFVRG